MQSINKYMSNLKIPSSLIPSTMKKSKKKSKKDCDTNSSDNSDMKENCPKPSVTTVPPNRYFIQHFTEKNSVIELGNDEYPLSMSNAVMISNCSDCIVNLTSKCNKIEIDSCKKIKISVPAILSSIDIGNSSSVEIHVKDRCPGLAIDNSQSVSVYINKESMKIIEIASSGNGSADIYVVSDNPDDQNEIFSIPFQFIHKFEDDKLVSEVSPLYTH